MDNNFGNGIGNKDDFGGFPPKNNGTNDGYVKPNPMGFNESNPSINNGFKVALITSILTLAISSFVFIGFRKMNPDYSISFNKDKVKYQNVKKFNDVRDIIKAKFYQDVNDNTLLEGAISGLAESLEDPYTVYYTKEQMDSFNEKSKGSYCGVGFSVKPVGGILSVIETFEDSPAKKAGIISGDKVFKVDDKDVTQMRNEELVINMIKGLEGTSVKLTVFRATDNKLHDFTMVRRIIKVDNIKSEVLKDDLGYIRLMMFDNDISQYFNNHLERLLAKGIKGIIIDVRDDPGGNYREVVNICDRLLPKCLVVYTQDRSGNKKEEFSNAFDELKIPIVVLINGNSASASEILAGALKDNQKGTLVGEKTFGKGLVQTVEPFADGSGIKITIARYFTPSGICIDKIGIKPDVDIPASEKYKNMPVSEIPRVDDVQLNKAIDILKGKLPK